MKRPLGVALLSIFLFFYGVVGILIAIVLLSAGGILATGAVPLGVSENHMVPLVGAVLLALGAAYFVIALSRFAVSIGLWKLKRGAWKGAFVIIVIGLFLDVALGSGASLLLGLLALAYLMLMRKHFRY
ncbi:MAG: hypothetical protein QCI38_05450 [Candidatus Thermoplasmatota archaeon]|nr:hypothetical protein [Candidatus Thermoplasmatota archaeon]